MLRAHLGDVMGHLEETVSYLGYIMPNGPFRRCDGSDRGCNYSFWRHDCSFRSISAAPVGDAKVHLGDTTANLGDVMFHLEDVVAHR